MVKIFPGIDFYGVALINNKSFNPLEAMRWVFILLEFPSDMLLLLSQN